MIALGAIAVALAGPVLTEDPRTPYERCVDDARSQVDVALPAPPALTPGAGLERLALVVGVPCHHSDSIPSLAYSSRDAARMGATLAEGGFKVVTLLDGVDRPQFERTLDQIEAALAPSSELVVYFSGHGVLAGSGDTNQVSRFLVFSDTDLGAVRRSALPVRTLDDRIGRMPARTRVVVQDTCFAANGGGKSVTAASSGQGRAKGIPVTEPTVALQDGDVRLYASQYFEQAIERPDMRASLYTDLLLTALRNDDADLDGNGCVDLREGHNWARSATIVERQGHQTPQGRFLAEQLPTLACTPRSAQRGILEVPEGERWTVEVRDARGSIVRRGSGPLDAGTYRVQVGSLEDRDGELIHRGLLDARVRVDAGTWVRLDEEIDFRSRPVVELTVDGTVRLPTDLPGAGFGMTALRASPSARVGRPTLGARFLTTWGSPLGDRRSSTLELLGLIGHTWVLRAGGSRVAFGPLVGAGAALVTRGEGCTANACRYPTSLAQVTARARWFVSDRWTLALDAGVTGYLREERSEWRPQVTPLLRIGVGPRL